MYLGIALQRKQRYADAEDNFRKALNDPDVPRARVYTGLGIIFSRQGDYRKAEVEYRKAYELDPGFPMYANNLSYIYARQGKNLDEALRLANRALAAIPATDPTRGYALDTRGWVYYQLGKYSEAESDVSQAISVAEKFSPESLAPRHFLLGQIYAKTNRTALAKKEYEKALMHDKGHKEAAEALRRLQ